MLLKSSVVRDSIAVMIEPLNAIDRKAMMIEKSSKSTLIRDD